MSRDAEPETRWQIQLFGEVCVFLNGERLTSFNNRKVAQLLLYIATRPSQTHSRDTLAELLWQGEYVEIARDRLRQTLSLLNKHFRDTGAESPIEATKTTLKIREELCEIDYSAFQLHIKKCALASDIDVRVELFHQAVKLASSPYAEGFIEDWVRETRDSIPFSVVSLCRDICQACLESNRTDIALKVLAEGLRFEPLDESLNILYFSALHGADQRSEAIQAAQAYEDRLRQTLGIQPSARWREARSQLGGGVVQASEDVRISLSQPIDRFFGREFELTGILSLLTNEANIRLITVTGQGGSGKTRLCTEVLNRIEEGHFERVIGLGLAELDSVDQVAHEMAEALQSVLSSTSNPGKSLAPHFSKGKSLVYFDNCEHLMPDFLGLIRSLLQHCPKLVILTSSRVRIGIHGERELALEPLAIADESDDKLSNLPAIQLLIDRIQSIDHTYSPVGEELVEAARLCRLLDGVPLAIELAAYQTSILSVKELRQHLEGRVIDLANANQDLPERHLALRNTLSWGYERLTPELQRGVSLLSLFPGPWSIEDAAEVLPTGDAIQMHEALKAVALISPVPGSNPRQFRMLEMVRQYARTFLDQAEIEAFLQRHLQYFTDKVQRLYLRRSEPDQAIIVSLFRSDLPNYRLAVQTGLKLDPLPDRVGVLLRRSGSFAESAGLFAEWNRYFRQVLKREGLSDHNRGLLWGYLAFNVSLDSKTDETQECLENLNYYIPRETTLQAKRFLTNQFATLMTAHEMIEFVPLAIKYLQEVIVVEVMDDQQSLSLLSLAEVYLLLGQIDKAKETLDNAFEVARVYGRERSKLLILIQHALIDQIQNDSQAVIDRLRMIIDPIRKSDDHFVIDSAIRLLICALGNLNGFEEDCAILIGFDQSSRNQYSISIRSQVKELFRRTYDQTRLRLGDRMDALMDRGSQISPKEILDYCVSILQKFDEKS